MDNKLMFKVIIAGSRGFTDYKKLCKVCDNLLQHQTNVEIVSGGATGADRLGERYAKENGYKITKFIPDWDRLGKSAGYVRNTEMANYANALIAFWDGKSRGTGHMINIATDKKLDVRIINYFEKE